MCYCRSSISRVFCDHGSTGIKVSYRRSIRLALPNDPDRLQMQSLGQNNAPFGLLRLFRHLVQASNDRDSWRRLPSPYSVPFSYLYSIHGTAFRFSLDGTEWNGNVTVFFFFLLLLYVLHTVFARSDAALN